MLSKLCPCFKKDHIDENILEYTDGNRRRQYRVPTNLLTNEEINIATKNESNITIRRRFIRGTEENRRNTITPSRNITPPRQRNFKLKIS
jgi:hypothetical protein